jgi:restriction system protein
VLYSKLGYDTKLTPPQKDGGHDILAARRAVAHTEELRIECMLYRDNVGVFIARALLGLVADEKVNKGVLVSTAGYTREGKEFAVKNPRLELIDGLALVGLLNGAFGTAWPSRIDAILRQSRQ